jgi:hypothetical protein
MAQGLVSGDMRKEFLGIIIPNYSYLNLLIHFECVLSYFRNLVQWRTT